MFAHEQKGGSLRDEFLRDLTFFILFVSTSVPKVYSTGQESFTLAIEPLPDSVSIVDGYAVHLTPGICYSLKLCVFPVHFLELAIEAVVEERFNIFCDELLASGRNIVP